MKTNFLYVFGVKLSIFHFFKIKSSVSKTLFSDTPWVYAIKLHTSVNQEFTEIQLNQLTCRKKVSTTPCLYTTFVRPHLAISARCPYLRRDIVPLESVQRRDTKLVSTNSLRTLATVITCETMRAARVDPLLQGARYHVKAYPLYPPYNHEKTQNKCVTRYMRINRV